MFVDGGHSVPAGSLRKQSIDFLALEKSAKLLNEQLARDTRLLPDLKDLLSGGASSTTSYLPQLESPWDIYHQKRIIPIPEALFTHFQTTSAQTFLGLFPELDRAWITVDEKLFLWDYNHGEFDTFTEQTDTIISVTLVNPKPNVFVDDIKHILVVCTTSSIILIGVGLSLEPTAGDSIRKVLKLYATDMVLSTKNVTMSSVVGTDKGRIFMAGSDGHLYELDYASTESWFSAKTFLKNHSVSLVSSLLPSFMAPTAEARITHILVDNFRHCLYTVTSPLTISVFFLGSDGTCANLPVAVNLRDIPRQIQQLSHGGADFDIKSLEIVGLHIVTPSEASSDVHAVAITSKGVRLYLSHRKSSSFGYGYPSYPSSSSSEQPTSLRIIHVRGPPGNMIHPTDTPSPTHFNVNSKPPVSEVKTFQITNITDTFYCSGLFIASQPPPPVHDGSTSILLCTFPDTPSVAGLKQIQQSQPIFGQNHPSYHRPSLIENIKLLPIPGESWAIAELPHPSYSVSFNELTSQFSHAQRELAILSHVGVTPLVKLHPVDILYRLIQQDNRYELELFYKCYGRDQTCGMLFGILAQNSYILSDPSDQEHGFRSSARVDVGMNARQVLFAMAGKPTMSSSQIVEHSGRLHGLAIYLARLVSSFWQAKVAKQSPIGRLSLGPSETVLVRARHNLHALHELYERDPFLFQTPPGEHRSSGHQDEAWMTELSAASQLMGLIAQMIEALSFVLLLHDFNLEDLAMRCDKGSQQRLAGVTFAELITTQAGRDLGRILVNSVINQQIDQQVNVDTISEVLHQRCGSFCSTDDVLLYKAEESVRKAAESRNRTERAQALSESLKLYFKCCKNMPLPKLQEVVSEYRRLHYAKGAIELPLKCAQDWDADSNGYEHWLAGLPVNDPRAEAYSLRESCYDLILSALDFFDQLAAQARDPNARDVSDDALLVSQSAFRSAINSGDAAFHSALYEWLIERGSADELLEIETPFLESHLQREPLTLRNGELLWQFYVKNGLFLKAAQTLLGLAETSRFVLQLDRRIEFLSLAVGTAKSHPISELGRQETAVAFLTELEEKLEVAQAQLQILETIHQEESGDELMKYKSQELNTSLKTVTELYEDYADPLNLPEMKLLLLHVSEHQDSHLVVSIWRYLFDRLGTADTLEDEFNAVSNLVERLGRKYYPSESAFPIDYIAKTLQDMSVKNREHVPAGWAARVLHRARVPYQVVFDQLHTMYESRVPPYHTTVNIQALSTDIAILLKDWLNDATAARSPRDDFPTASIARVLDSLVKELSPSNSEGRKVCEEIKQRLKSGV